MRLTAEEQQVLEGERGSTLRKVMEAVVRYGEMVGAERLVDIEGDAHFSTTMAVPGVGLCMDMLNELAAAGLRTKHPFTLDPNPPLDFENLALSLDQERSFREIFRDQARYDERMLQIGLRDGDACTCTPYLPEVGNIPAQGKVLAWSESSCVVFANSVLGARTNRNAAGIDLLSNIIGKTPLFGLLTEPGRRATWLIEVRTSGLPNPQLLGGALGVRVLEDVPFITGLDRFLGTRLNGETADYLKEMGAACAAIGAVGLYHVENITPEAVERGRSLLAPGHRTFIVDDQELEGLIRSYGRADDGGHSRPDKCLIGCPHLSLRELYLWTGRIGDALRSAGRDSVAIPTILCAAPQVLREFRANAQAYAGACAAGIKLSAMCPEGYMDNPLCAREVVVTNSNKLRAFTTARMLLDDQLIDVISSGEVRDRD